MAKLVYSGGRTLDNRFLVPKSRSESDGAVLEHMRQLQKSLCSQELDVMELARRFGYDARGLSIPKTASLIPLYATPSVTDLGNSRIHTFCIGLRRSESDPRLGEVNRSWKIGDLPEVARPFAIDTDDVTCYVKYHVVAGSNGIRLVISPIQKTRLSGDKKPVVDEIVGRIEELEARGGESGEIHRLARQVKLLEKSPHASVFKHDDRDIALALIGLAVAEAFGVTEVGLRTYPGRNTGYAKRAEQIMQFLRTGKSGFRFSEGYI